ncbi:MAG: hypothetical protein RIA63_12285 [Cyclobacteriaceae bacterium]
MKRSKSILSTLFLGITVFLVSSCDENADLTTQQDLLPESFRIEIPTAISNADYAEGGRMSGRTKDDMLQGNDIYENLGTFIAIGDGAAEIVEGIIIGLKRHKIDRVLTLSFISEDDNRVKNLVVESNVEYEGTLWEYQLTMTDAESEGNPDGGKAM